MPILPGGPQGRPSTGHRGAPTPSSSRVPSFWYPPPAIPKGSALWNAESARGRIPAAGPHPLHPKAGHAPLSPAPSSCGPELLAASLPRLPTSALREQKHHQGGLGCRQRTVGPGGRVRSRAGRQGGGRQRAGQARLEAEPRVLLAVPSAEPEKEEGGWGDGAGASLGLGWGRMCSRDAARAKGNHPNNSSKTMSAPAQKKHPRREEASRQRGGGSEGE